MDAKVCTPIILGYQIREVLYTGSRTRVYRAIRQFDQLPVVIKLLTSECPSFSELLQFRNQYSISKNLPIPGIIHPLALETYGNGYILVMADSGGIALREYIKAKILSLDEFLAIAIQLANILQDLHQNRVIHKDIKPANILINPQTKQVQIIDFSIASLLPRETQEIKSPNVLEGTLAYISPEQTGRMNRGIDYRSDFYSLGVTFYEILTGNLPFICSDPMELLHCHIAKQPDELNSTEIPQVIAEIVMKLMAKNAEDRYQSALGLKFDLEKCLSQSQLTGKVEYFAIGEKDSCDRFLIPEKLYGRETEVQTLLNAFKRVTVGASELMLVAGSSGIGKTAIVNEVHKPIVQQRGYFIKGKFDQFNRNIPFSAFVQAFRDLMGQLLSESDTQLQQWKTQILAVVGENAQVLIEVIPELEIIIGKQPPAPELLGSAAQNRFNLLFQKFIQIFTTVEHPLVIFLDDLQWADSASFELIKLLMQNSHYLLVLGAYRDNEVSPIHPFILMLEELKQVKTIVTTITLPPLTCDDTNHLVADTLNCSLEFTKLLTELIQRKTQGNPFFTTQFLKALHEEKYIIFNCDRHYWECDLLKVNELSLTDDVVEFMALQLQKLPAATQKILKLAACVGNTFDLATVMLISEQSPTDTSTALWKALQEGLIIPTSQVYKFFQLEDTAHSQAEHTINPTYRFLHDRIQQAAYSLIPDDQKQVTHYQIGQQLLSHLSEEKQRESIFDIVNHLNMGSELITTQRQRNQLAKLNLMAGEKALAATAYSAAAKYFDSGVKFLHADSWQSEYRLTLSLYESAIEAEYLNINFAHAQSLANFVLERTTSLLDRVKFYELQIQMYMAQSETPKALAIGMSALELLGVDLNNAPASSAIYLPQLATIESLPVMQDAHQIAVMRILMAIFSPAYTTKPELLSPIVLTMINLSLKQGHTSLTAFAYVFYGIMLCGFEKDLDKGYYSGLLALKVLEQFSARELECKVSNLFNVFIRPWKEPLIQTIEPLGRASQIGFEMGDIEYASYATAHRCTYRFLAGENLVDLQEKQKIALEVLQPIKQHHSLVNAQIWQQLVSNLLGDVTDIKKLSGEHFDETELIPILCAGNDRSLSFTAYLAKCILSYLFADYPVAVTSAVQAANYADAAIGVTVALHNFYYSLALLSQSEDSGTPNINKNYQSLLGQIEVNQKLLKVWAVHAPKNFEHKYNLVEAEKCRVLGKKTAAIELYDRAIGGAIKNNYIQEAALSNELAAKFYLDWGKEKIAQVYMQEAYYGYANWGAAAKTEDLEYRYPNLLLPILQKINPILNIWDTLETLVVPNLSIHSSTKVNGSSSSSINNALDFTAILKASQALSMTIVLDELLQKLTQIVLQNSGGDYCALILPDSDGNWHLKAIATLESTELVSEPLEGNFLLPVKLIQYVKNTQAIVAFDNLKTDLPVIGEYLTKHQPKSVVCLPILNQGNLIGIVYLKNQSTSQVFTNERILILNFLCTQAAISLENARLHAQERAKSYRLEQSQQRLQIIIQQTPVAVLEWNTQFEFQNWNPAAEKLFGYTQSEILGKHFRTIIPEEYHAYTDDIATSILAENGGSHAINENITKDGRRIVCEWFNAALLDANGEIYGGVSMGLDISDRQRAEAAIQKKSQELEMALKALQQAQLQIIQSEKMSALGNLVAGIAHEMNNPLGFIAATLKQAKPTFADIIEHLKIYQETLPDKSEEILDHESEIDLEYSLEDLPKMLDSMTMACDRLKNISTSLRTFSRADRDYKVPFNLHEGIDSTILILKHRLKANEQRPAIEVITSYGNLPQIECFPGQLNQVFMNILANAIDALEESNHGRSFEQIQAHPNLITITTSMTDKYAKISITDNGKGMSEEVKCKIFDHLFTTKAVDKGTGLGLAIALQIVEEKHNGQIAVNSVMGEGTEFLISLPIKA
ncbi:ATP-binding sensor histidine kinase [Nostoc sp. PCC 7107]|uniref:ATP-binding sensor histidine kinase n=1 Tax=Nostoc sp. PCC 7107 TaxID=317936 RepID=UPI00029F420E|nr:ATP-binding sensor histidine kinase [Nostoc sp. PCC 7107]AFY42813.1 multi-sensor signal transduction multi-kinase [Nostoc sp. PCC 7107]